MIDSLFERRRSAVIEDNHAESVGWVVLVQSAADSVEDDLVLFTTAGHKDIHGRTIVTGQAETWASSLLQGHHSPAVMHERGDHDSDLNGDEHPGGGETGTSIVLGRDDTVDTQNQVAEVYCGVTKGQERSEEEDISSPALPDLGVVTVIETRNGTGLDPVYGITW